MLQRLTIGTRLAMAFSLLVLLLLVAGGIGVRGLSQVKNTAVGALEVDTAIALNAAQVQQWALQLRRYEKDTFINFRDTERVAAYYDKWTEAQKSLAATLEAGTRLAPTSALHDLYQEANTALGEYAAGFDDIYQQLRNGVFTTTASANSAFSGYKTAVYDLQATADTIGEQAEVFIANAKDGIVTRHQGILTRLLIFAGLALSLAIALSLLITRSIVYPLALALTVTERVAKGDFRQNIEVQGRDETSRLLAALRLMTDSLSSLVGSIRHSGVVIHQGAESIAQGGHELASRTEQQASALQQSAASIEEITSSISQNAESTRRADHLAEDATHQAQISNDSVARSVSLIHATVADAARMNSIIETIDTIAFQTNILALNASVEAARAGDKGSGFAVVATEVRALASRSAEAAGEIRQLLGGTRQQLDECAHQVEQSGISMSETMRNIERLSTEVMSIGSATREQSAGLKQISTAVAELDSATQQNADLVQATSTAAASLEAQAGELRKLVVRFQIASEAEVTTDSALVEARGH